MQDELDASFAQDLISKVEGGKSWWFCKGQPWTGRMAQHTAVFKTQKEAREAGLNQCPENLTPGIWVKAFSYLEICRRFSGTEMQNDRNAHTAIAAAASAWGHQQNGSGRMGGSPRRLWEGWSSPHWVSDHSCGHLTDSSLSFCYNHGNIFAKKALRGCANRGSIEEQSVLNILTYSLNMYAKDLSDWLTHHGVSVQLQLSLHQRLWEQCLLTPQWRVP